MCLLVSFVALVCFICMGKKATPTHDEKNAASSSSKRHKAESSSSVGLLTLSHGESYVSQRGVTNILNEIKANGLPDSFSRSQQFRARKGIVETTTPYGPLLEQHTLVMKNGKEERVSFQNPFAWLYHICEHSAVVGDFIATALLEKPSLPPTPWTIILYQDGVDPGDTAVKEKSRHSIIFYWSFSELGMRALCREEIWSSVVVARTHLTKCLTGGPTELTHRVVRMFHGGVHDMATTGVSLRIKRQHYQVVR